MFDGFCTPRLRRQRVGTGDFPGKFAQVVDRRRLPVATALPCYSSSYSRTGEYLVVIPALERN